MSTVRNVLLFGLSVLVLVACGGQTDTSQPPEILYGQDVCDRCDMIINEERFASAYWTAEGEARRFDDIGGMLLYHLEQPEDVESFWVHDVNGSEWLRADDAYFVLGANMETPMGFSIIAYADRAAADDSAAGESGAMVMTFDRILAQMTSGELVLDPMHGHDNNMETDDSGGEEAGMSSDMSTDEMSDSDEND